MRKLLSLALVVAICVTIVAMGTVSTSADARDPQIYNVPTTADTLGGASMREIVPGFVLQDVPWWVGEGLSGNRWMMDAIGDDTSMEARATANGIQFWRSPDSEFHNFAANPIMGRRFGGTDMNTLLWINANGNLSFEIDCSTSEADAGRQHNISAWPVWHAIDPDLGGESVPAIINLAHWIRQFWTNYATGGVNDAGRSNTVYTFDGTFMELLEEIVAMDDPASEQYATGAQRVIDIAGRNGGWFPVQRFQIMATVHHAGGASAMNDTNSAWLRHMSWEVDGNTVHPDEAQFLTAVNGGGAPTSRPEAPATSAGPQAPTPPVGDNMTPVLIALGAIVAVAGTAAFFATKRRKA